MLSSSPGKGEKIVYNLKNEPLTLEKRLELRVVDDFGCNGELRMENYRIP